jgi:hypothetical protein
MSVTAAIVSAIVNSVGSAILDAPQAPPVPVYTAMARSFPAGSKKGLLTPPLQQPVVIDGVPVRTAPGLQVRNEQNLIVMPNTLQGVLPIRYQLDPMGNVWRIWILSAAEQAAPDLPK